MANILNVAPRYAELIMQDFANKTSEMYVDASYVHNSSGQAPVDDITLIPDAIEVGATASVISDFKVAVVMQENLATPYTYDRIYLVNKNDFILHVINIDSVSAISEVTEDLVINISDIATVLN